MTFAMDDQEETYWKSRAVYYAGMGGRWNRLRAWWSRLGVTTLDGVLHGRVWPYEDGVRQRRRQVREARRERNAAGVV